MLSALVAEPSGTILGNAGLDGIFVCGFATARVM